MQTEESGMDWGKSAKSILGREYGWRESFWLGWVVEAV